MVIRTLLIDTDTASDDAVALIMALRSPVVHVAGITVVAGNVPLRQGVNNALYTAELCGSAVPVFAGAHKPLVRDLEIADWFHGKDGLGDHGYVPQHRGVESTHAVEAIIEIVRQNPGIEIVTLGPLTNIALALQREPDIAGGISRCVVMGGSPCCVGNVTPAAEFNMWVDPEAAQAVFRSGLRIEMVGWQLCRGEAVIGPGEIEEILTFGTPFSEFAIRCNSVAMEALHTQTGEIGICLPDPVAMGIALAPHLCLASGEHYVDIETQSDLTRGMTVVDRLGVATDPRNCVVWSAVLERQRKVHVCWTLNVLGWKSALQKALQ